MNRTALLLAIIVGLTGCATTRKAAKTPGEKTWDAMSACVVEAKRNPVAAQCESRFRNSPLTATIRQIRPNVSDIDLDLTVSESTYGARYLVCGLDGAKYYDRVVKLKTGDEVMVQGSMGHVFESPYFTTIILRPCDLVDTKPR